MTTRSASTKGADDTVEEPGTGAAPLKARSRNL